MSDPLTKSKIALKGSSKIVSDYFEYSINSLLYQRDIYPAEDFQVVKKYGMNMMLTIDEDVKAYIKKIMAQLHKWVSGGKITKLVVPIVNKQTDEVVERWEFNLEIIGNSSETNQEQKQKSKEEIQREIQAIIRQITSSVTFLPILEGPHSFNVLVYTDTNTNPQIPSQWIDTRGDGKEIGEGNEAVKFRSFSTSNHKVDTIVSYKMSDK